MRWNLLFWAWFLVAAVAVFASSFPNFSRTDILIIFLLLGIGLSKLAEDTKRRGVRKSILNKLK
jgi:hypothetical protein